VAEREIVIDDGTPLIVAGYEVKARAAGLLAPFCQGAYKVLLDPRSVFCQKDSLEGLVLSEETPELFLLPRDKPGPETRVQAVVREEGGVHVFRHPLEGVKPGAYDLTVKKGGAEVFRRSLTVASFAVEKPLEFERTEPSAFTETLPFLIGQEYLNCGRVEKALESFNRLPAALWNGTTLPVIARAHYLSKDYARVIELLETETVPKDYGVLLLLGNSSLELKKLKEAAFYFEEVRKFGDTAEANNALGAIYFSLGEKDKAKVYWERARKIENRAGEKTSKPDEERR
jgi:tetratricopeptide (TPR) repeat protein